MKPDQRTRRDRPLQAGTCLRVVDELITFKITGAETQGRYCVFEILSQPQGGPIGLHAHPQQQTFYVLDGIYIISMMPHGALLTVRVGPGAAVHVPAGVPHSYRNVALIPARLLAIVAPADFEQFIAELGVPMAGLDGAAPAGPPAAAQIVAAMTRHNVRMLTVPDEEDQQ
jgi:quercetin dioxygenase-like cupin family protein